MSVTFDAPDHTKFDNYNARHVGTAVAFTIDNQILSAPTIASPITSAAVMI